MILTLLIHKDIPIKHASHKINAESWYHQGFHHIKWLFPSIGLSSPGLLERLLIGASSVGKWHQKGQKNRYLILTKKKGHKFRIFYCCRMQIPFSTYSLHFLTFGIMTSSQSVKACSNLPNCTLNRALCHHT